jgi:hypothetical protein
VGSLWAPAHLLLFAQSMIDEMIHYGFDVRRGNAVPRRPLSCEIWEASTNAVHIGPISAPTKSEGAEYCLDAFGPDVFNALGSATIHASSLTAR